MPKLALLGGAYQARSVIANAQRCVNLYPEANQQDAEEPITHYPTPGLRLLAEGDGYPGRGLYTASNGDGFLVSGTNVWFIDPQWGKHSIAGIGAGTLNPVSMSDNNITMILVDGSGVGWQMPLAAHDMTPMQEEYYLGADKVDYLDTYMLFNKPNSQDFYCTLSNEIVFDPLYVAGKVGGSDPLVTIQVMHREIWLLGTETSEVWYDAGNSLFPFAALPGAFMEQGCAAKYSVAKHDLMIFWLGQNKNGHCEVLMGANYRASRISTHAIEYAINGYEVISDAIGFVYLIEGHIFYVLTFPTADHTWVYDARTQMWHEWVWVDSDGAEHRARVMSTTLMYGQVVGLDWENGNLYAVDLDTYTDNGQEIVRRRGFPHVVNDGKRVSYKSFIADIEAGDIATDSTTEVTPRQDNNVYLRWSDSRGRDWSQPVGQPLGNIGDYLNQPKWSRLGMARDRVFELFWSCDAKTALNGAWIDPAPMGN